MIDATVFPISRFDGDIVSDMKHGAGRLDAADIVRRCRRNAGISQRELARRIGTAQPAVSRWERGHDEPRLSTLDAVARACGTTLSISMRPSDDTVDLAQLRQNLALTPDERLASVTNLGRLVASARPARR